MRSHWNILNLSLKTTLIIKEVSTLLTRHPSPTFDVLSLESPADDGSLIFSVSFSLVIFLFLIIIYIFFFLVVHLLFPLFCRPRSGSPCSVVLHGHRNDKWRACCRWYQSTSKNVFYFILSVELPQRTSKVGYPGHRYHQPIMMATSVDTQPITQSISMSISTHSLWHFMVLYGKYSTDWLVIY